MYLYLEIKFFLHLFSDEVKCVMSGLKINIISL